MAGETTRWRAGLRRWRWLLIVIGLIVLVRANLPWVLRRVLETQASEMLKADVTVGDIDLALYKGGVALEDFAIRLRPTSAEAPASADAKVSSTPKKKAAKKKKPTRASSGAEATVSPAPFSPEPSPTVEASPTAEPSPTSQPSATSAIAVSTPSQPAAQPTPGSEPQAEDPQPSEAAPPASRPTAITGDAAAAPEGVRPILAWKRFAVSLHWLPLFRKTVQLREVVLESPQILLERLNDGSFNFEALVKAALEPPADATPSPAAVPSPTPEGEAAGPGWQVGVDRAALGGGSLRFQDYTLRDSEPVDIDIPAIEVRDIALSPDVYGRPSESQLKIQLEQGSIDVSANTALSGTNVKLDSTLKIQGLPLRHARLYVPGVGWSELNGALDTDLAYRLETDKANEIRGSASVRDLSIRIPDLPKDALALKKFTVRVDPIDLQNSVANVAEVDIDSLWVVSRPSDPIILPFLPATDDEDTEEKPAAEPEGPKADGKGKEKTEKPPAPPWRWSVKAVRISGSGAHLIGGDQLLDVHLGGQVGDLAPGIETRAPVDLTIGAGEGTIQIKGTARVDPPGFAGNLLVKTLSLPELIKISGAVPENPLQSAKLDVDLGIEADMAKPDGPKLERGDLRLSGKIGLSDTHVISGGTDAAVSGIDLQINELSLAGAVPIPPAKDGSEAASPSRRGELKFDGDLGLRGVDAKVAELNDFKVKLTSLDLKGTEVDVAGLLPPPAEQAAPPDSGDVQFKTRILIAEPHLALADGKDFLVTLKSLELGLSDVDVPGVLAPHPGVETKPIRVAASDLKIQQPQIRMTLTSDGMVLPGASPASSAAGTPAPTAAATPAPSAAVPAATSPSPAPGIELTLDRFQLGDGRVSFNDRTLKPPHTTEIDDIKADVRGVHFPELTLQQVKLTMATPDQGEIDVSGSLARDSGTVEVETREVTLLPYNPYTTSFSPYELTSGALSLKTTVTSSGKKYEIKNAITLHDLDVEKHGEGEGILEKQIGMPVSSIIALLQDPDGNIKLNVPVQISEQGTSVDLMTIVGNALKAAMVGALTSPLKLVGSITGGGDKVGFAPKPITFRPGTAELTDDGAKAVDGLVKLMQSRPAVGVELRAQPITEDGRRLREQALLLKWQEEGFFGGLAALGQRGARSRVRDALEDRSRGGSGELSPEDTQQLDEWLTEIPEPGPERLKELAQQRITVVADGLRAAQVDETRLALREPTVEIAEAKVPAAKIRLRPVSKLREAAKEEK